MTQQLVHCKVTDANIDLYFLSLWSPPGCQMPDLPNSESRLQIRLGQPSEPIDIPRPGRFEALEGPPSRTGMLWTLQVLSAASAQSAVDTNWQGPGPSPRDDTDSSKNRLPSRAPPGDVAGEERYKVGRGWGRGGGAWWLFSAADTAACPAKYSLILSDPASDQLEKAASQAGARKKAKTNKKRPRKSLDPWRHRTQRT